MSITPNTLISRNLADHAARSFGLSGDGLASIYLHLPGGRVSIGGGSYGAQWIESLAIDDPLSNWIKDLIIKIDSIIDLDFEFSDSRATSNLDFYIDTEIAIGASGQVLGLSIPNSNKTKTWWEVVINGPKILADPNYLRFAVTHELGHTLGLEHPFDQSDGDSAGSAFADPDASVTVMSYTRPSSGWPDFWQPADLTALVELWGLEDDQGPRNWLLQQPSGELITLDTQAALDHLASSGGDLLLGLAPERSQENAVPRGEPDHYDLLEDTTLFIPFGDLLANDEDPDGNPLQVVAIAGSRINNTATPIKFDNAQLTLNPAIGLTVIPTENANGRLSTTYTLSDGMSEVDVPIEIDITPQNDAPIVIAELGDIPLVLGESFTYQIKPGTFFDVDGDDLSIAIFARSGESWIAPPEWLSFEPTSGWLQGSVPMQERTGSIELGVVASDPFGLSTSAPLLFLINPPPSSIQLNQNQPGADQSTAPVDPLPTVTELPAPKEALQDPSKVVVIAGGTVNPIAAGTIGFGTDQAARLMAQRNADNPLVPSVLAGGSQSDQYVVAEGGFTVIADSPLDSALGGTRDQVTGLKGSPRSWSVQVVGGNDWLLSRTTPAQNEGSDPGTLVLLADPLGRIDRSHRLENLVFTSGRRQRRLSPRQAFRQFNALDPIEYNQLTGPISQNLEEVVGDLTNATSLHGVIASVHAAALS
mgnify:CR=1 FL=1